MKFRSRGFAVRFVKRVASRTLTHDIWLPFPPAEGMTIRDSNFIATVYSVAWNTAEFRFDVSADVVGVSEDWMEQEDWVRQGWKVQEGNES